MVVGKSLWAFLLRDVRTARSYRLAWVLDLWGGVFSLVMFYYLSQIVNLPNTEGAPGQSVDYFPFVVIGIALYNFLITGVAVFGSSLKSEQAAGTLEVLLSLPSPPTLTMFGVAMYGFLRSLLTTCLMLGVAVIFFGLRIVVDPFALVIAFISLVASVALFASLGIVIAALTIVFKQVGWFTGMVIQGLGLLSGVFYPVTILPQPLQLLAELVPLTWALNVLRQALLAGEVHAVRVVVLILTSVIAMPVAFWIFHVAVKRARQDGSLAQY